VKHIALALETKGVWVTECRLSEQKRLRALAFWFHGAPFGDYEYDIAGTPCELVVETCDVFRVEVRVVERFPVDPDMASMPAVSYTGTPLLDANRELLGHLAALDDQPMPSRPRTEAVFRIFAARAAWHLPPLHERGDDTVLLTKAFARKLTDRPVSERALITSPDGLHPNTLSSRMRALGIVRRPRR
jgi:hypothetical protein